MARHSGPDGLQRCNPYFYIRLHCMESLLSMGRMQLALLTVTTLDTTVSSGCFRLVDSPTLESGMIPPASYTTYCQQVR
jgi:hypothetical protein